MLRFVKVKNKWHDTLEMMKQGLIYHCIDGYIYVIDKDNNEVKLGKLQKEKDSMETKDLRKELEKVIQEKYPHLKSIGFEIIDGIPVYIVYEPQGFKYTKKLKENYNITVKYKGSSSGVCRYVDVNGVKMLLEKKAYRHEDDKQKYLNTIELDSILKELITKN